MPMTSLPSPQEQGKLPEAEALLRQSVEAREETLGVQHPETVTTAPGMASEV